MQFTTTALAILLPAFAAGISNSCGDSSFVRITLPAGSNPLVSDCQLLITDLAVDKDWPVSTAGGKITSHGTCAFYASAAADGAIIGNQDVADLVRDSIKRFAKGETVAGKGRIAVGGAGEVPCSTRAGGVQIDVDWNIGAA